MARNKLRLVKINFPGFSGEEDTTSQFHRVEQYFDFNYTTREDRVALASVHLKDNAQLRYPLLELEKGKKKVMTWQEF